MNAITKNGLKALAIDSWDGEGDLATFTAGFVAAWSERSTLANVTIEARDKRIAELEAAMESIKREANWVLHVISGVGKSGDEPTESELQSACKALHLAITESEE